MEGFYFTAILSRHCHPCTEGFLLFSSDFIQTLQCTYCICPVTQSPFHIVIMHCPCGGHSLFGRAAGESKHNPLYTCINQVTLSYTDTQAYSIWRFYRDTANLGYSVEGLHFPAILSRHCHPWVLSGGLLFSGDFIETLPPLH